MVGEGDSLPPSVHPPARSSPHFTVNLPSDSALASAPTQLEIEEWSGRRDSNPRHPAWKERGHGRHGLRIQEGPRRQHGALSVALCFSVSTLLLGGYTPQRIPPRNEVHASARAPGPRPTSSAPRRSSMTRLGWQSGSATRKAYPRAWRRQAASDSQAAERLAAARLPCGPEAHS